MATKVEKKSACLTSKYRRYVNGLLTTNTNNTYEETWDDIKTGEPVPNYRSRIRRGVDATSLLQVTSRRINPKSMQCHCLASDMNGKFDRDEWEVDYMSSNWGSVTSPLALSVTIPDRAARQQFLSRYRGRRTALMTGVLLGELRETVEMIKNPAKALRTGIDQYYRDVKRRLKGQDRGRPTSQKRKNRLVRDTWLEYNFGWAPLVGTIEDVGKLACAHPYGVRERITGHSNYIADKSRTRSFVHYGAEFPYIREVTGSVDAKYKGVVRADNNPPSFPEQLGLSWSNFLPTVWELIPYSFLVDYFTNVSNVIDGISTGKIKLGWGCRVHVKKREEVIKPLEPSFTSLRESFPGRSVSGYSSGGGPSGNSFILDRVSINSVSVGIRDLAFELPGTGSKKWLNIGALARLRR